MKKLLLYLSFLFLGQIALQAENITFCVDLSCYNSVTAPSVFGSFNGWSANANFITDPDNDNIYCTTLDLPAGVIEYKFFFQEEGPEDMVPEDPCTVTNYGYTNRVMTIVPGVPQTVTYGWEVCGPVCIPLTPVSVPLVGAPDPDCDIANVISMFSNTYMDVTVDTWLTSWSAATLTDVQIAGNDTKLYENVNFLGIETVGPNLIDASAMTSFSLDVWTPNMTVFKIKLVDFGPDAGYGGGDDTEHEVVIENPTQNSWNTYNIPLSAFSGLTGTSHIAQLILSGTPTGSGIFYLDNVYFSSCEAIPAAPDPTCGMYDVLSLFSEMYSNVTVDTWLTGWSSANLTDVELIGNATKLYENVDFLGIETVGPNQLNVSGYSNFNIDVWTPNMTTFRVKLVDFGADANYGGGDDTNYEVVFDNLPLNQWNTLQIPLASFTGMNFEHISQLIFSGIPVGGGTFYLDNVYFSNCQSMPAAPDPICDAADVISMFSNSYTDVPVNTWKTFWSSADLTDIQVAGNDTKLYENVNFLGIETVGPNQIDASTMINFHFDMWTPNMTTFRVKLVDFGPDANYGGGDDTEYEIIYDNPTQNTWNTFEIPLSSFTGMNFGHVAQFIFSGNPAGAGTFYLDNVYFSTCCNQQACIANFGGPTIVDPCECAGGGEFDEEVVVYSQPYESWVLSANSGYIDPATGVEFPINTPLVETFMGSGVYTLVGQHMDDVGYSVSVQQVLPGGTCVSYSDLLITGAFDGPLTGGTPKGVELFVVNDIPDLSIYGLGSANNGGGTDGEEFTFPAVAATAGTYIYVASEATQFTNFFGFAPDYTTGAMGINGDDAVELFENGVVVDVFGDIDVDGNGTPWEYLDSWAYRNTDSGANGTFVLADWTFGGPNAYDGETSNATAATPMPLGTYTCTPPAGTPVVLSISNECWYPDPSIDGLGAEACIGGDPITLNGSAQLGDGSGPATMESESWSGTGVTGNVFDPAVAGLGPHTISYNFDAVDNTPNGKHPGCLATVTQDILVVDLPVVPNVSNIDVCMGGITMITPIPLAGGAGGGTCVANADLVLTGVFDGPLSGGTPKGVELYVANDIADLSIYGLGSANNGGGSDGEEFTFPAVSATAGTFIYVASETVQFTAFFGFAPDYTSGSMSINGDDAIELFESGVVVEVFGDINVDGNGQPWEYMDSWASRISETTGDGTFNAADWNFAGANAFDGETSNATAANPMPIASYSCTAPAVQQLFNFYADVDLTVLLEGGVTEYDPGTTIITSPQSIWVTSYNEDLGCESAAVEVVITVYTPAVAVVGENITSCGLSGIVYLAAMANYPGEWTTYGFGNIADPTNPITNYTPNLNDIGTTVVLTWTTFNEICGNVSASMGVLMVPETEDAEFSYDQAIYYPGDADPVLSHATGVDGQYTYTVDFCGPELGLDSGTGSVDKDASDAGIFSVTNTVMGNGNLIITGVIDGPLSGGLPKAVELYALADIYDLSIYGISSANNGNGPTGAPEFTFPADPINAGDYFYLATDIVQFTSFFGFAPDYVHSQATSINGDDAIELFCRGQVIDVFGDVNVDGSNEPWEYLDGWAYRQNNTDLDGEVFRIEHWNLSGPNALDGETSNAGAATPFPAASFSTYLTGVCDNNTYTDQLEIYPDVICPGYNSYILDPGMCSIFKKIEEPTLNSTCYGDPDGFRLVNDYTGETVNIDDLFEFTLLNSPYSFTYWVYDINNGVKVDSISCSFGVSVSGYPLPIAEMACNDQIQISLNRNCEIGMNADFFLEGGPYQCYNQFEVYVDAPGFEGVNVSNQYINLDLGTYYVTVVDAANGNSCTTIMVVEDKLAPEIFCETCPPGGILPYGGILTEFVGELTVDDPTVDLLACWDFDFGPINGQQHPVDVYAIQVDQTGEYTIYVDSDWNDSELAIYDQPIDFGDICAGVIGGGNDNGPGFEAEATLTLTAGVNYYIGVSNYSSFQLGGYILGFISNDGNVMNFGAPIYADDCVIEGCDVGAGLYDLPTPEIIENCDYELSYTDEVVNGPLCGTKFLRRTFTATDNAGMTAECTQEYFFTGTGLDELIWPKNFDGLYSGSPMLECSDEFPLDENGNPHPSFTGYPEGFDAICGTIETFYTDRNYNSDCGPKILRDWVVIDDCKARIEKSTQIIRISDNTAPVLDTKEGIMSVSTTGWSCMADYAVPVPIHFYDNCDADPQYYIGSSAGTVWQDPDTGLWYVFGLEIGMHEITYFATDWCGNRVTNVLLVEVFDGIPPVAVCEQYKQTSLTFDGTGTSKIFAEDFDSGSHDNGCGPVWLKVLRNDLGCPDYNGDDKPGGGMDIWFDDYVMYCCEDAGNEVMTTLRVFDVDPGQGPISPSRTEIGGDLYGHYNDCWTIVTVEEKVPPQIICEDKYITCEENYDPYLNPGLGEPVVYSTCGNYDLDYSDDLSKLNVCGVGVITRTWTVSVNGVAKGSCKQKIYLEATTPFDPLTIIFPYITSKACLADVTGGAPTWETNPCNVVGAEIINIDTFKFVDDACYKIIIDWAVIDWCVYEPNTGAESNVDEFRYISGNKRAILDPAKFDAEDRDGYYKFTEILMVYDQTAANIMVEDYCLPTETCLTSPETHVIEATAVETDADCGGIYDWTYVIHDMATWDVVQYSHNNQEFLALGEGVKGKSSKDDLINTEVASLTILPTIPEGAYRVLWTLSDGCSNTTQAYQYIEVADKKPPTPFMVDVSTALMWECMIEVWVIDFDKGACDDDCLASYDNCAEILYFTFTPILPLIDASWSLDQYGLYYFNPETGAKSNRAKYEAGLADAWDPERNTAGRIYTWPNNDDGPPASIEITIYVWDKFALNEDCDDGNYDYTTIDLTIDNNGTDCGQSGAMVATGLLNQVKSGEGIDGVVVGIDGIGSEYPKYVTGHGNYAFTGLTQGDYEVSASKNDDYGNGVSTLDLILIQKHLLGIKPFDNVYDYIAADGNGNGTISAADLFELRKLVLGVSSELSIGKSWIFIDENYEFQNLNSPWQELSQAELIELTLIQDSYNNNFHGIKVGDVNGSAKANINSQIIEGRSDNKISLVIDDMNIEKEETIEIAVLAQDLVQISGAQFTLNVTGLEYAGVVAGAMNVTDNNFGLVNDGTITFSWNKTETMDIQSGEILFSLKLHSNVDGRLSDMFVLNSTVTPAEAYTTADLEISPIELKFRGNERFEFALYQNEPNPFSEETMIGFSLPVASEYTLSIMDVTGRVLTVIQDQGAKGMNTVNVSSQKLPAGVLYYQLESNDQTATLKMIIIK